MLPLTVHLPFGPLSCFLSGRSVFCLCVPSHHSCVWGTVPSDRVLLTLAWPCQESQPQTHWEMARDGRAFFQSLLTVCMDNVPNIFLAVDIYGLKTAHLQTPLLPSPGLVAQFPLSTSSLPLALLLLRPLNSCSGKQAPLSLVLS